MRRPGCGGGCDPVGHVLPRLAGDQRTEILGSTSRSEDSRRTVFSESKS